MKHFPQMVYSIMKHDGTENLIGLDILAFKGPCKVIADSDNYWGGPNSAPYEGELIVNPTWGQLFLEAIKLQQNTLDFHHSYFEGAEVKATVKDGGLTLVQFIRLHLGS